MTLRGLTKRSRSPRRRAVERSSRPGVRGSFIDRHFTVILVAPAVIMVLAVMIGPLLFTFVLSFFRWDLTDPTAGVTFDALGNYQGVFQSSGFYNAVKVSSVFTSVAVTLEVICGLGLALLATARRSVYASAMRVALLAPAMLNPAIAAIIWRWIFAPDYGVLNFVLSRGMGIANPPQWLASDVYALPSVVIVNAWITTPFVMLILVAALQAIPDELYEAASIDGAGSWARFADITLPLLRRALMVVLVLRTIDAFRLFDLVFVLTKGGPGTTTETLAYYIFRVGFNYWQMGFAGALSVIMFLIVFALSFFYVRIVGE